MNSFTHFLFSSRLLKNIVSHNFCTKLIMSTVTTANSTSPPPSPAVHPHNSNLTPTTAILCLVALVILPMILYTFFIAMKCNRNPFRRTPARPSADISSKLKDVELVYGFKYRKSRAEGQKEAAEGGDQCPVCLSVFCEGEEIRQLNACRHAFHATCIDMWLYSHSNCPVCRAAVLVKRLKGAVVVGEDDFRQGLPDAENLL
ncbi:RING-H2 finger protein ATL33-like [Primulina eburnea]|uniref:RING-H2 finger protein ATL33-like n=1 Tax=Primulina eburnea TaxID=1245227 RepID=UPI003C6C3BB7